MLVNCELTVGVKDLGMGVPARLHVGHLHIPLCLADAAGGEC